MEIEKPTLMYLKGLVKENPTGVLLSDTENDEIAVVMSPEYFQLLTAAAKLASNQNEYLKARKRAENFQRGTNQKTLTIQEIFDTHADLV